MCVCLSVLDGSRHRTAFCAELLLPDCVRLPPDYVRFSCCSPFAAPRLRPLQLLIPIASTSAAAPRLRPLQLLLASTAAPDCMHPLAAPTGFQPNVLEHSSWFSKQIEVRSTKVARHYSPILPHEQPTDYSW